MDKRIVIVGGGAAGLVAAIAAASVAQQSVSGTGRAVSVAQQAPSVTILEHMDRVGKKLLSTGNGRCNLTNLVMGPECYRCGQGHFPMAILGADPVRETLSFFEGLGIVAKDRNGYVYPNSEQASAVLDSLRLEARRLGVRTVCGCHVKAVLPQPGQLAVVTDGGTVAAAAVVVAAGSKAAPATGSDGSGYEIAAQLGHRIIKPLPALVQLRCAGKHYQALSGVRCEARLTLMADGVVKGQDTGELQLTDYGISGIPTFQISRFAAVALERKQQVVVMVDFLPAQTEEETRSFLRERIHRFHYRTCEELLLGVLNKKLALVLFKLAGIGADTLAGTLDEGQFERLLAMLKAYRAEVTETNSFAQAQVCCGGVDTREIDPDSLESRLVKGVYFAGEVMDVDGICGGYNLQWAWSTGMLAGRSAAMFVGRDVGNGAGKVMANLGDGIGKLVENLGNGVGKFGKNLGNGVGRLSKNAGNSVEKLATNKGHPEKKHEGKIGYDSDKPNQNASKTYRGGFKRKGGQAVAGQKRRSTGL